MVIEVLDERAATLDNEPRGGEPKPLEMRAAQAALQTGVEAARIERMPFDLSALEEGGILVNVDARNFGLLDRRLDWQALGITL